MANELRPAVFRISRAERLRARLHHLLFLLSRPMTLGVRAVIHDRAAGAVFLIRHTYVSGWHLPGGGVESGETAEQSVVREVEEECAIRVSGRVALQSFHYNRYASRRDHVAVYLVEEFAVIGVKQPDHEIAEARFFRLDALPEQTTPATRRRLAELFGGEEVSAFW